MLTRRRKKFVALIALFAVIFAALMPATASFARVLTNGDIVPLSGVCSTNSVMGDPAIPLERAATHGHCAFCTLGAPLAPGHRVDALLAVIDVPTLLHHVPGNDALPRDVVAFHRLSPRAPPHPV